MNNIKQKTKTTDDILNTAKTQNNRVVSNAIIWGAGGYTGAELLRLVSMHGGFNLCAALSASKNGKSVCEVYPSLAPFTDIAFTHPDDFDFNILRKGKWTLFCAMPHVVTMKKLGKIFPLLLDSDTKVVDLSGDFRLQNPKEYKKYYGEEHATPSYLKYFVYGLPEMNKNELVGAQFVSNPGCFATCAQLALLPFAKSGKDIPFIAVDAKTGSSGSGANPKETTHHPLRMNNFKAYKMLGHRHFPEIADGWTSVGGCKETLISFVPQSAPMVRGIFVTAHIFSKTPFNKDEVEEMYLKYYRNAPFVSVNSKKVDVANVWGTNRCHIDVIVEGQRAIVAAVIDNLVKGASGQAVQNANIINGFEETQGLLTPAPFPV